MQRNSETKFPAGGTNVATSNNTRRDYKKLYEKIANSEWFKKAYFSKSLGERIEID